MNLHVKIDGSLEGGRTTVNSIGAREQPTAEGKNTYAVTNSLAIPNFDRAG